MDERKLLLLIKDHPVVYNPQYKNYKKLEARNAAWKAIATTMNEDVELCQNIYTNLRFEYQNFVRKLRKWFRSKRNGTRPTVKHENDMIFLWRFISDTCCDLKRKSKNIKEKCSLEPNDKDMQLYYKKLMKHERITRLLTFIEECPEIYEPHHEHYGNPIRKGIIWNAISEELGEESWRCIKTWLHIKLEYEFLLALRADGGNVDRLMEFTPIIKFEKNLNFMKPLINIDEVKLTKTYKMAPKNRKFIRTLPSKVEEFMLLSVVKQYPQLYRTEGDTSNLSDIGYKTIWTDIARRMGHKTSSCEQSWTILNALYKEIINIRQGKNPLNDKWDSEDFMDNLWLNGEIATKESPPSLRSLQVQTVGDKIASSIISLVKKYPQLYKRHRKRRKEHIKNMLWDVIGQKLNLSGETCRQTWSVLRFRFDAYRNGTYPKNIVFTHHDEMSFLLPNKTDEISNLTRRVTQNDNFVSKDALVRLITEVKKYPILYDYACREYLNPVEKKDVFREIGYILKCRAKEVESTWSRIKIAYWRYLENPTATNSVCDFIKFVKPIETELRFLKKYRFAPPTNEQVASTSDSSESTSQNVQIVEVCSTQSQDEIIPIEIDDPEDYEDEIPNDFTTISSSNVNNIQEQSRRVTDSISAEDVTIDKVNMLIFMSTVKKYPVIYDPNHDCFHNKIDRLNAWTKISSELKCTLFECDIMWNDMIKKFLRYKELDPEFKLPINSSYWKDMIHMYTRKSSRVEKNNDVAAGSKLKETVFDPLVHILHSNIDVSFVNLWKALNTLPESVQKKLCTRIESVIKKIVKKDRNTCSEVICIE